MNICKGLLEAIFRGTYAMICLMFLAALSFIILMLGLSYLTLFYEWKIYGSLQSFVSYCAPSLRACAHIMHFHCFRPMFVNVCGILLLF